MGKDEQSCHSHLHSAITASTTSTKTIKRLTREDGNSNKVVIHGFAPHRPRLTSLTPLPFGIMPFSSLTLHYRSWLLSILFDVRIYMMPIIMCRVARHTIGNYPHYRNIHNQIDGGDFAFSSSPRLITIYTSCKRGQNQGCDKSNA